MTREIISANHLLQLLNTRLGDHPETEQCAFAGEVSVYCDENGCHWVAPALQGEVNDTARKVAARLIMEMQTQYSVDLEA